MTTTDKNNVSQLLGRAREGERSAPEELLPLVYDELRRLAGAIMSGESTPQTLQPTALVHEAYLRLLGANDIRWDGRGHFFAAAATAMRRILIERARRRGSIKGGHGRPRISIENINEPIREERTADVLLALDIALERLAQFDEHLAKVVMLRSFGGLTIAETARALGSSTATVKREWRFARVWLLDEMTHDDR